MKRIKIKRWVKVIFFLLIFTGIIYLYARYVEPKFFKIKEYSIINDNIPNNFYGFKIVQISDINYKTNTSKDDLNKIVKKINLVKPDVVIFTGDLLNKKINYSIEDYNDLKEILSNIDYTIGKYFISGDNDLEFEKYIEIMESSNFINLNDKYELIYNEGIEPIALIGISSNYKNNHIRDTVEDIYTNLNTDYYSVLILHEPDFINYVDYSKFNLVLAGHSLNGQIKLPFIGGIIKQKYSNIYYDEHYNLGNTPLYISGGIGTSKYKVRLFNMPSVNFYRLRNK